MGAIFARVAKEPVSKPILPLYSLEWFGQQAKDQRSQLGIAGLAIDRSSETWPGARPLSRDLLPLLEVSFRPEPIVQISPCTQPPSKCNSMLGGGYPPGWGRLKGPVECSHRALHGLHTSEKSRSVAVIVNSSSNPRSAAPAFLCQTEASKSGFMIGSCCRELDSSGLVCPPYPGR
jgi:hypothetical protein